MKKAVFSLMLIVEAAAIAVILTVVPAFACGNEEWVNPHGMNVPPAGWSTLPGENINSGKNPDGFYRIYYEGPYYELKVYFTYVGNEGNPQLFGPFEFKAAAPTEAPKHAPYGAPVGPDVWQVVVKITEAPGAAPSAKMIGSNSGNVNNNGQAGAVDAHITLPADALWSVYEADGVTPLDLLQTCILVPPPPK